MKTNIEVEGWELALKNSHGDIVIIPKDKRTEVLELLEEDCYDCIDGIVDKLPVMSDYAEDGSLIPSWESVKAAVNPSNWGVEDYSEDGDFNNAFGEAKYNGLEEFMWNNKRYNTKTTMTPTQQMEEYGITDKQRTTNPSQT